MFKKTVKMKQDRNINNISVKMIFKLSNSDGNIN